MRGMRQGTDMGLDAAVVSVEEEQEYLSLWDTEACAATRGSPS